MYRAGRPEPFRAGYHSETMSSLAFSPGTQGSGRPRSTRCKVTVPTGWDPVGAGSSMVAPGTGSVRAGLTAGTAGEEAPATGAACGKEPTTGVT
nr:hypothetical protein GCM10020093_051430 [Planobispora longispora]